MITKVIFKYEQESDSYEVSMYVDYTEGRYYDNIQYRDIKSKMSKWLLAGEEASMKRILVDFITEYFSKELSKGELTMEDFNLDDESFCEIESDWMKYLNSSIR